LQKAKTLQGHVPDEALDPFWTLTGYFNALRELAGTLSLYRQDIQEWLKHRKADPMRDLDEYGKLELSSRVHSTDLPAMLKKLEGRLPTALDAVLATSMFGTGVDIDRLSLMVVHGQPKTTASYIQATGRVGRQVSGLVVVFFRATRPRDLDHYEFFTGYHRALYRYVEPITVAPFSPRARERALGPLSVILLRQARQINGNPLDELWRVQQRRPQSRYYAGARIMKDKRYQPEVKSISVIFEQRAQSQPEGRIPPKGITSQETESEIDRWYNLAQRSQDENSLVYYELSINSLPQRNVILGDPQHRQLFEQAFENVPQSLRDVEETTTFQE